MLTIIGNKAEKRDPRKHHFLGHEYIKDGRLYGDARCPICGDWFTWKDIRPKYCFEPSVVRKLDGNGFEQCRDWMEIREQHLERKAWQNFEVLLSKGFVS